MNMKTAKPEKKISHILRMLGQPTRVHILLAIGEGEACVCHLESLLGQRQAYISQHLMALRKENILDTRREGRFIFYSLRDPRILDLIYSAAEVVGVSELEDNLEDWAATEQTCVCPHCEHETSPLTT